MWGPSWVCWRYTDAYCGWAPLPPAACYHSGVGFTYYGGSVGIGFDFGLSWGCYGFVSWGHFNNHHLNHYCVPPHQVNQFYNHSVVVNNYTINHNTVINQGIPPQRVAAATRSEVRRVSLSSSSHMPPTVGRAERMDLKGQTLSVYRPQLPPATRTATTVSEHSRGEFRSRPAAVTAGTVQNNRPIPAAQLADSSRGAALGYQAPTTMSTRSETPGSRTSSALNHNRSSSPANNRPQQFSGPVASASASAAG